MDQSRQAALPLLTALPPTLALELHLLLHQDLDLAAHSSLLELVELCSTMVVLLLLLQEVRVDSLLTRDSVCNRDLPSSQLELDLDLLNFLLDSRSQKESNTKLLELAVFSSMDLQEAMRLLMLPISLLLTSRL